MLIIRGAFLSIGLRKYLPLKVDIQHLLVGGFNLKNIRQIGTFPPRIGVKIKIFEYLVFFVGVFLP